MSSRPYNYDGGRRIWVLPTPAILSKRVVRTDLFPFAGVSKTEFLDSLAAIQRRPGSQRVHVISPMDDLSVLDRDDRDEPVVIGCATRKNRAMHFVLENHDATIPGAVHNKCVAGVKLDRLAVSGEACHQTGASSYRRRPAGKVIARFEEAVFGKRGEIKFAVNKSPKAFQDDSEKGIESFKHLVLGFCHKQLVCV